MGTLGDEIGENVRADGEPATARRQHMHTPAPDVGGRCLDIERNAAADRDAIGPAHTDFVDGLAETRRHERHRNLFARACGQCDLALKEGCT